MKNKKHKKTSQQLREEHLHEKNHYFQKIKDMMGIMGDKSAFGLLGPKEIEMLYMCRLRPVKIKSPDIPGDNVAGKDLKILNDNVTILLKNTMVNLGVNQPISLYDFCSYIETIYLNWRNADEIEFVNAGKFREKFPVFYNEYKKARVEAFSKLNEVLEYVSLIFSDIIEELLWFEPEQREPDGIKNDLSSFHNNYFAHFVKPESIVLDIDHKRRSVFRVGLVTLGSLEWLTITPGQLGRHGVLDQFPLKIYIQMHAIERIKERLGPFFTFCMYMSILTSILEKNVCISDDGNFLFAYSYRSKKIGYLKADIFEDKLIIRTFLFITNNGTPEGKRLSSLLGVVKEDKKYLGIDKLSTFIESDIEKNENLQMIFSQAGCGHLFELKKYLADGSNPSKEYADYLSHYLCLNKHHDATPENESVQLKS